MTDKWAAHRTAHKQLCLHNQIVRAENALHSAEQNDLEGWKMDDAVQDKVVQWYREWVQYGYALREQMYPRYRDSNIPQTEEGRTEYDEVRAQRIARGA